MTVTPLEPDQALSPERLAPRAPDVGVSPDAAPFGAIVRRMLGTVDASLDRADDAERAFVNGNGGLQEMMIERGKADVLLSIAAAAATRTSQAISTIFGMQV